MSDSKISNEEEKKKEKKLGFWGIINSKIVIFGLALIATYVVIDPILTCLEKRKKCERLGHEIGYRLENIEEAILNDEYLLAEDRITEKVETWIYPEFEKRRLVSLAYEYRNISGKNKEDLNNLVINLKKLSSYRFDSKTKKDFYKKFRPLFKDIYSFLGVSSREFGENEITLNKESESG